MPASTSDASPQATTDTGTPASGADAEALLHLVAVGGRAGPRRRLLESQGGPAAALSAGTRAWRAAGLDDHQAAALRRGCDHAVLERALRWLERPGHALLGWHDPDYPPQLRRIASPPLALFLAGDPTLPWRPSVAVVGSRAATPGGRELAFAFATQLARAGFVVASGLASGIDAAAHRAALALGSGRTIAVVGCGADIAYPPAHRDLLAEMGARGCVVSEHLPGTQPRREFFPSRNRILAGMALGTLVVEAGRRSGALITARQAAEAGREVFAIPGSIHSPLSRGCHRLIRDGAALVEEVQEVIDQLAPLAAAQAADLRAQLNAPIHAAAEERPMAGGKDSSNYKGLWQILGHDPTPMDVLVERSGLTAAELSSMLLVMELEGRVFAEHGRYSRR